MSSRSYVALVAVWVLAAAVSVTSILIRRGAEPNAGVEALPTLPTGLRAPASYEVDDTLPSALTGVASAPVQGRWTGPGGRPFHVTVRSRRESETDYRYRRIGMETFYLLLRTEEADDLTHDPCSSCHQAQGAVGGRGAEAGRDVHQNIQPVHPELTGARCVTCHAAADPGRLALERGDTVSIDHAYQLCAQCHFSQVESWAKGAHGKRLVGWRGRRVVMGCADCHDPHDPAAKQRIPMAGLSLPGGLRARGDEEDGHGAQGVPDEGHQDERQEGGAHE